MRSRSSPAGANGRAGSWWIGALLFLNIALFYFGFTEDALTLGTTIKKQVLGFSFRLVDQRATYSLLAAIFKLWEDGNHILFVAIFLFSVVFPAAKIVGNLALWWRAMRTPHSSANPNLARAAHWLHALGRWSMVEVFAAGLLVVLRKIGDVVRVVLGSGFFWFLGAVLLSVVNALLTERFALRGNMRTLGGKSAKI